jgi:HK97 family phage major capsid protein
MATISLAAQRAAVIGEMRSMLDTAGAANRDLTVDEASKYDQLEQRAATMATQIQREQALSAMESDLSQPAQRASRPAGAPNLNLATRRGDSELRAMAYYMRTGDPSALAVETRASNDTDMNIGTAADGGYAVPTGIYNGIVAKRNELALYSRLGVMPIPGRGTTVNVPTDNGTANVFVATSEAAAFDRDAPVLGQQAMTLVLYSKKVQFSYQVLEDEDAKLQAFVDAYVGRALALTENSLLIAAALAGGTTNALAAAAAATAGDIPKLVYALKGEYADGASWVMRRATEGAYRTLTGSVFQFAPTPAGTFAKTLWDYPIVNSESVEALATGKKSLIFGNFSYIGRREGDGLGVLRDPYSAAGTGQVNIYFYTRLVYKVTVAEAIQYGTHP